MYDHGLRTKETITETNKCRLFVVVVDVAMTPALYVHDCHDFSVRFRVLYPLYKTDLKDPASVRRHDIAIASPVYGLFHYLKKKYLYSFTRIYEWDRKINSDFGKEILRQNVFL